jgi:hypothetical protein
MSDHSISCPSCGTRIPLTRALRLEIEASMRLQFEQSLHERESALRAEYDGQVQEQLRRAHKDAAKKAEKKVSQELAELRAQVKDQARDLDDSRGRELALRKREREVERKQQDLELTIARHIDKERSRIVTETAERLTDEQRLKDAEKERQLADLRRQIDELKRKAEQGSQQLQGEAAEEELESVLQGAFPSDEISAVGQGVRGADLHHIVIDGRGRRSGAILWECKNTRHWNDAWVAKLKQDQRAVHADVAVLVSAALPKWCAKFAFSEGVLITNFTYAASLASVLRANLWQLAQVRSAAINKEEKLELLYRYLSGVEFRQRVEAVVEAFAAMRQDLDRERRAAERQWARRARQIDAVTFNVAGLYGDLQGLVPALPSIPILELPEAEVDPEIAAAAAE